MLAIFALINIYQDGRAANTRGPNFALAFLKEAAGSGLQIASLYERLVLMQGMF